MNLNSRGSKLKFKKENKNKEWEELGECSLFILHNIIRITINVSLLLLTNRVLDHRSMLWCNYHETVGWSQLCRSVGCMGASNIHKTMRRRHVCPKQRGRGHFEAIYPLLKFLSCHDMSRPCDILSRHVISHHVASRGVMSRHVTSCRVM